MKKIIAMLLTVITLYIIFQIFYTGRFFKKSEQLIKITYTGEKELGNTKDHKFNLLIDGDSVGAGVGATSFETSVSGRVANYLAKNNHVFLINNSVSGSRMATLIDKNMPSEKQDLTLLIVSSNDLFHFSNLEKFEFDTNKVIKRYSENSKKLIIIGPGRVFDTAALPFFIKPVYKIQGSKYAQILSNVAQKYPNVVYVNPLSTKVSREKYGPSGASDGFHPNDEGHRFWFDLIKPFISDESVKK